MAFIEIRQARLYYQEYGQDEPARTPVVLIHGSTSTGQADWGLVAPLLARRYRVIVPDCRGHGQSSNPGRSYSFLEMAADTAALVKALGYPRAHIVGHSNGGNVALVTLVEHPEIVASAVLQAANAFVSPDLLEKEPAVFDPERVRREDPAWLERMQALHAATHGPDYWQDLLRLTVQEIISGPDYTPADLAKVQRPVLVIQGENDQVNAPARHAQFIARHIPDAELWVPESVGHNVHEEVLFAWVDRVVDFLERRGEAYSEALYRLKQRRYPDGRTTVFEVQAQPAGNLPTVGDNPSLGVRLTGRVLEVGQRQEARLSQAAPVLEDQIQVLLDESTPWALVKRTVTDLRRAPRLLAERVSQAVLGEAVRILMSEDGWAFVQLVQDGYLGWIQTAALQPASRVEVESYWSAQAVVVQAGLLPAYPAWHAEGGAATRLAGRLPFGVRLPLESQTAGHAAVRLPDGAVWWVDRSGLLSLSEQPAPNQEGIALTLKLIEEFIGIPYLWGGRTPFGFDCSGLAQAYLNFLGISVPRDADQQFQSGAPVNQATQPGDLLFFGEIDPEDPGKHRFAGISHVAISLGGDDLVHANGTAWGVSYNSLNSESPRYLAWLKEHLVGVRRFV